MIYTLWEQSPRHVYRFTCSTRGTRAVCLGNRQATEARRAGSTGEKTKGIPRDSVFLCMTAVSGTQIAWQQGQRTPVFGCSEGQNMALLAWPTAMNSTSLISTLKVHLTSLISAFQGHSTLHLLAVHQQRGIRKVSEGSKIPSNFTHRQYT